MQLALEQSKIAFKKGEVPIGAIIVDSDGKVVASAYNLTEAKRDVTAHAEILAIKQAAKKLDNKYLKGCTMFVTLEPCAMCAQAISNAKIKTLIYGAADEKSGGVENGAKVFDSTSSHHKPEVISGIMEDECSKILTDFFKKLRYN